MMNSLIRTKEEELKYNFCEKYRLWRSEAEKPMSSYRAIEAAWELYVDARENWIFGPRKTSFKSGDTTAKRWELYRHEETV